MDKTKFSRPLSLKNVQITDTFWKKEMELVRTEVIEDEYIYTTNSVNNT